MKRYGIIVEPTKTGFSAHVPDLPGCVAAGRTRAETRRLIRGALRMHLAAMARDGDPIPEPTTGCEMVEV